MKRPGTSTALAFLVVLLMASPAVAGNFVRNHPIYTTCPTTPPFNPCLGDNATHDVYVTELGPNMEQWTIWTLGNYNTTDLNIVYLSSHTSTVDVYYRNNDNLPNGTAGIYYCVYVANAAQRRCAHSHVEYQGDLIASQPGYGATQWAAIACHETGHSVGLLHPADAFPPTTDDVGCMSTEIPPVDAYVRTHNTTHIQGYY